MFEKDGTIEQIELYSFDIFDTLITRKVAKPTGIFVLLQDILNKDIKFKNIPEDVKVNFFQYRTDAEFCLRRINNLWHDGLEINFNDIYSYIKKTYNLTYEQTEKIKELEFELELESVVPIKENIDKIKNLLAENKRVVLISDMYLPADIIKQMLHNADPILSDIKLYLSSQVRFMKKNSELYKYVKIQENVEYKNWLHCGDNKTVDYAEAKKLGINTNLYNYIEFENYETKLLSKDFSSPIVQLVLGCTKNLRLNKFQNNIKAGLGISLAGPILYPYISWILNQSQKLSIKRLYFIARDGYILKEIADTIISQRNIDIETFYIYGSRKAWRLSGIDINNDKLYKQFIDTFKYDIKNIHTILGLEKEELINLLPKELKKYHKAANNEKLQNYFLNNKEIIINALKKNELQKINAIKYLKNNINCSDENFAFVDLDGSGITQNCLASLLSNFYNKPVKSFYYAVTPLCYEEINIEKYCFIALKKPFMGNLIELLTRAPHGQTIGYDDYGIPILEQTDEKIILNWNFNEYIKGAISFTECINKYSKQYKYISFEALNISNYYINYLFNTPDKKTANCLGSIIHKSSGNESSEYSPKINLLEALKYLFTKKIKTENINFSKARSHSLIRKIINYKTANPDLRKQIINVLINKNSQQAKITIMGITISFKSLIWKNK